MSALLVIILPLVWQQFWYEMTCEFSHLAPALRLTLQYNQHP